VCRNKLCFVFARSGIRVLPRGFFLVFSYCLGGCDYVQSSHNSICYCFVLQIFSCLSRFQLVANFSANLRFVFVATRPPASQPGSFVNAFSDGFASDLLIFGFLGWRRVYILWYLAAVLCVCFREKKKTSSTLAHWDRGCLLLVFVVDEKSEEFL
jgi:hypothetical protein